MTKIYEAKNHILIHTGYGDPDRHSHMAAQVILSLDGDLRVQLDDRSYHCYGAALPSGISHRIDTGGKPVLVFLFDCTTCVSAQIREFYCLPEETCRKILQLYTAFETKAEKYDSCYEMFLDALGFADASCVVTDPRILESMDYICARLSERITCRQAAEAVCLSQSRFSHLFRKETGMTFSAYVIRQRLLYVYVQSLQGKTLTEAAYQAGFSSSAHFADVNRRVFGISASQITRDGIYKTAEI